MDGTYASQRRLGALPGELTSFVGRRRDVAEIRSLVGTTRLTTLVGPGGVGKTRIAIQVAAGIRRTYRDGVWFIDLAGLRSPELLPDEVGTRLLVGYDPGLDQTETVTQALRDWEALIVLDTCEHLVTACAEFVTALLRGCPDIRVLATSREPVHLPTERVYSVQPFRLSSAPGGADAEDDAAAVQLFGDRASAVVSDFVVSPHNRPGIARICAQLDGLPLAIELAAQQVPMFTVRDMIDRLDRDLELPTRGGWRHRSSDGSDRHASLEATLAWSYQLCSPAEQLMWRRASIFSGGFELTAAEAVCGGDGIDEVVATLSGLLSKSVLIRERDGGTVRMRLLDSVRDFGLARLTSDGERDDLAGRHAAWMTGLARELHHDWFGPHQREILDRLERERPNLRSALSTYTDTGGDASGSAIELVSLLWFYWLSAGHLDEGALWLGRGLDATASGAPHRPRGLWTSALFAILQLDPDRAEEVARTCIAEATAVGDVTARANADHMLGLTSFVRGDLLRAESFLAEAVRRFDTAGASDARSTMARIHLGMTYAYQDRIAEAVTVLVHAEADCAGASDAWVRAYALQSLALASFLSGDLDQGVRQAITGLAISRDLRDGRALIPRLDLLGWIAAEQRDAQRAATLLGAADALWPRDRSPTYRSKQLTSLREQAVERARTDLGPERFDRAFATGADLDLDQALAYALAENAADPPPLPVQRRRHGLTTRELEIADLVATGMSNKAIASQLVLSTRTVENHVQRILTKLGFNSRTQVAVWAVRDTDG